MKFPPLCATTRGPDPAPHRSIICRTFGVAVPDWSRIDVDGYAVFELDPRKHDPFKLFDRMKAAVDSASE